MIKFIVAIDKNRGMANEHGIPWAGKTPTDLKFFRDSTIHSIAVMGYGTYVEFDHPLSDRRNLVIVRPGTELQEGFEVLEDPETFLKEAKQDIWVIGGAGIFTEFLHLADELYITQLDAEFRCTKFFPEYEAQFALSHRGDDITENDITYHFETWVPRSK